MAKSAAETTFTTKEFQVSSQDSDLDSAEFLSSSPVIGLRHRNVSRTGVKGRGKWPTKRAHGRHEVLQKDSQGSSNGGDAEVNTNQGACESRAQGGVGHIEESSSRLESQVQGVIPGEPKLSSGNFQEALEWVHPKECGISEPSQRRGGESQLGRERLGKDSVPGEFCEESTGGSKFQNKRQRS